MPSVYVIAAFSGIVCAGLYAAASSGLAGGGVLALLSPVPLFYAVLAGGSLAGGLAAAVAFAGVALLQGASAGAVFLAIWGLPAAVAGGVATMPVRNAAGVGNDVGMRLMRGFGVLSASGVFIVLLSVAFLAGASGWGDPSARIATLMNAQVTEASAQMALPPEAVAQLVKTLSKFLPGFAAAAWMLLMVASAALAQGLVKTRKGYAGQPFHMADLRLPRWLLPLFAGMSFAGIFGRGLVGFAGANAAIILLVPFMLDGLAVLHAVLGRMGKRGQVGLWVLYGSLLMFNMLAIPVAGLGIVDQWSDLRRVWMQKLSGRENE